MDHFRHLPGNALWLAQPDQYRLAEGRCEGMTRSVVRFVPVALLLIATAILLHARSRGEVFPPRHRLQSFPQQLGGWEGTDVAIDEDALQVLGPGDFLLRV